MKNFATPTTIVLLVIFSLIFGCGNDHERPDKALVVTGTEELAGATVSLDGVVLGSLELLEKPPKLVLWVVSRLTGNEGPGDDGHETVTFIFDLDGTEEGDHLVVINHPNYQPIEKPFNYPENMAMNSKKPESGVVLLAGTKFDLIPSSGPK